jgi:hypothetical protein
MLLIGTLIEPPNLVLSLTQRKFLIASLMLCQDANSIEPEGIGTNSNKIKPYLDPKIIRKMIEHSDLWFKSTLNEFYDAVAWLSKFDQSGELSSRLCLAQTMASGPNRKSQAVLTLHHCPERSCSKLWEGTCKNHHNIDNATLENLHKLFDQFDIEGGLFSMDKSRETLIDQTCKLHPYVILQKIPKIGDPNKVYYRLPKCQHEKRCQKTPRYVIMHDDLYECEFYCDKVFVPKEKESICIFKQNHNIMLTSRILSYNSIKFNGARR